MMRDECSLNENGSMSVMRELVNKDGARGGNITDGNGKVVQKDAMVMFSSPSQPRLEATRQQKYPSRRTGR